MPTKTGIILDEKTRDRLRRALGDRTITSLAKELGVTYFTLSGLLTGLRTPSVDLLTRTAAALGLTAEVDVVTKARVTLRRRGE